MKIIPEAVIDEMYSIISTQKVPSFVTVIKPHEFHEKLQYRTADFSQYRRIHHIGDINGSYTALMKYLECGLNDTDLYIFTGDFTGSTGDCTGNTRNYTGSTGGAENAEVIKFLILIMCRDNVILLEGDQEKWLCNLATDEEQRKISEFQDIIYSLQDKKQEGITKNCILELTGEWSPAYAIISMIDACS